MHWSRQVCLSYDGTWWWMEALNNPDIRLVEWRGNRNRNGNEVLPQDTTQLIQRPCYQRGCLCQGPAGNRTTRRRDHHKEMQTAVVWSCLPFIRSGQNHLARHNKRGKKTRQTEEEVGNNVREWIGPEFAKSQRAVENREKWRILVAKSSVVPQRPSRLRD